TRYSGMNIKQINDRANGSRWIRPLKWAISARVHKTILSILKRDRRKSIYAIHGMQRTGNHAIINWIMKGSMRPGILCNDLSHGDVPMHAAIKKYVHGRGRSMILSSYEDRSISKVPVIPMLDWYGPHADRTTILIIRDPFNLFASRYVWKHTQGEWFRNNLEYRAQVIATWKEHAHRALSWSSVPSMNGTGLLVVNYNKWVVDVDYRNTCSLTLGLELSDAGLNEISGLGGGSSFHGTSTVPKTVNSYNQRFQALLGDPVFEHIFKDPELWTLSDALFGNIPGTEEFRSTSVDPV
ncbi:MAG: hypothetical protein KA817_05560, partial [Flavobacteriales bacterium]|nr:hypothetical protein [Flavobacteriales bacterium]